MTTTTQLSFNNERLQVREMLEGSSLFCGALLVASWKGDRALRISILQPAIPVRIDLQLSVEHHLSFDKSP